MFPFKSFVTSDSLINTGDEQSAICVTLTLFSSVMFKTMFKHFGDKGLYAKLVLHFLCLKLNVALVPSLSLTFAV